MDIRERYTDREEELRLIQDALQARIWTMLPGTVLTVSVTDGVPVAAVRPEVMGYDVADDGTRTYHRLPDLPHCPIWWPRGGGYSMTFPIAAGDECMLLFGARALDEWWQSGGAQPPYDLRQHDLSDAVCLVGLTGKAKPLANISTETAQFRADDGSVMVELDKAHRAVNITGPGGIKLDGPVTMTDTCHIVGDTTLDGSMTASGDVVAGEISLKDHEHSGVQSGSSNTGAPV